MPVSSAKGKKGSKKGAPKHQNTVAFHPNKYSPVALKIAALPTRGLCKRCHDIIEWKKRMNKYKPLKQPSKCVNCLQKTVRDAYHVLCAKCSKDKNCCAKCQEKDAEIISEKLQAEAEENVLSKEKELVVQKLPERYRRSFYRKWDRGDYEGAERILTNAPKKEDNDDFWGSDFDSEEESEQDEEEEEDDDEDDDEPSSNQE